VLVTEHCIYLLVIPAFIISRFALHREHAFCLFEDEPNREPFHGV